MLKIHYLVLKIHLLIDKFIIDTKIFLKNLSVQRIQLILLFIFYQLQSFKITNCMKIIQEHHYYFIYFKF
jgi:hypothetical protein